MAASQMVCSIFGVVFERLKSLIHKDELELSILVGVKKELEELYATFCEIKDVLNDAEERQLKEEAVLFWLQQLNAASYEADDVFDELQYEALQQLDVEEVSSSSNNSSVTVEEASSSRNSAVQKFYGKVRKIIEMFLTWLPKPGSLASLFIRENVNSSRNNVTEQLYGKVQKLIVMFNEFANKCSGFDLQKGKSLVISLDRRTLSLLTEPQVYGRDEDREKLVKQLLGSAYLTLEQFQTRGSSSRNISQHPRGIREAAPNHVSSSSQDNISIFPILGMGGLGKTTLAQPVYNDERVKDHFKDRSWVCVSNGFDIKHLMKAIVATISGSECDLEDFELLQRRIQKELHGKKFLLVLDDVWEESREEWNKLKALLRSGNQDSSVIVTTRLPTIATITGTFPPHCLSSLSEKHCWALFKQYAFGPGNEKRPTLVEIGKKIVKKCGGLPLAAKALGGLLRIKNEDNEWDVVEKSEIWELPQNKVNGILPALRLSYYHLPLHLKQCFVYCSIFPKDYEIYKENLIELWMANGLVPSQGRIELEDAGNEIFNTLLGRSFFQEVERDEDGDVISCKMHDLVHDLASYIAGDEYFAENNVNARNITSKRTRHVSLLFQRGVPPPSILEMMQRSSSPQLHSLIRLNGIEVTLIPEFVFSKFIRLRALDLKCCSIEVVPDSIVGMIHLRYLNLSSNPFTSLPESICLLRNVQTLNLEWCETLEFLPKDMRKMRSLRHLNINGCQKLTSMPVGMGHLTCLQKLKSFIVGKESGCGVNELQGLNKLRGVLEIRGLENVKNSVDAKEANLMNKKNLRWLRLIWPGWNSDLEQQQPGEEGNVRLEEEVIEGFQPHSNLRSLFVRGYGGVTLSPSWLKASLVSNLVKIYFFHCRNLVSLGGERGLTNLTSLKTLVILSCPALKRLPQLDKTSLSTLIIKFCREMEFSKEDFEHLGVLDELRLIHLPKLTCFPEGIKHASVLHILEIRDCSEDGAVDLPDWIGTHLTSLQVLIITSPKNWKVLPQWMQQLTALQRLLIWGCEEKLIEQWKKKDEQRRREEDANCFNMVSHVPNVFVTSKIVLRAKILFFLLQRLIPLFHCYLS